MRLRAIVILFGLVTFIRQPFALAELPAPPKETKSAAVLTGVDVLQERGFEPLRGKQVGLITNQTGRDARGRSTADVLAEQSHVKLIAMFSPEHGIRGDREHGRPIGHTIDPKTGLPVYSLYGETKAWDPLESTCRHASLSIL